MINVFVIGAGTMGGVHADSYSQMDHVNLIGILDIRQDLCEKVANRNNTKAFFNYEEAEKYFGNVDVIDICLPTFLHKEYVVRAASLGKHIICEKPLARNLKDAREMIEFCQEKGVKLFVGHVIRFFPEYSNTKQLLDAGKIGDVAIARTTRGGIFPTAWEDWYADFEKSGGLVLDMIIHDFDFLRWCFGDVERVYAKSLLGRNFLRMEYALVTLRFKSGVIAHVEGTWAHEGFSMKFELAGKTGIIDYDSSKIAPVKLVTREEQKGSGGVAVPESPLKENPYYLELKHFMECIEKDCEPQVTAEDAYKVMEISLAALESIKSGKPVSLYSGINQ